MKSPCSNGPWYAVVLTAFAVAATPAAAAGEFSPKDLVPLASEFPLLPAYCRVRLLDDQKTSPEVKHWQATLGPHYVSVHHYCFALNWVNRAKYKSGGQATLRKRYLDYAIREYNYMLNNPRPGFVLLPEMYRRRGEAYLMLGNHPQANRDFESARQLGG
jgi:hypothetical protein